MSEENTKPSNAAKEVCARKKTKPLPRRLLEKWISAIGTLGAEKGLSSCEVFLENKMANDVFFKGLFKGEPCIVKCSSIAPGSIRNEYEMLSRLHKAGKDVFPEPLAYCATEDGKFAFAVTRFLPGETLTCLAKAPMAKEAAEKAALDIVRIAEILKEQGIVHGDIISDNLIAGPDGHLNLIDFQFATDRLSPKIDPWLENNPKFRFLLQGVDSHLGLGVWNDAYSLRKCLAMLPRTGIAEDADKKLSAMEKEMVFKCPPAARERLALELHLLSLHAQKLIHFFPSRRRERVSRRIRKLTRLLRNG